MAKTSTTQPRPATPDTSLLVIPGVILGTYALSRLPFGLFAGLAIGFATGWAARGEQDARHGNGRERSSDHDSWRSGATVPDESGTMIADEKVDDMAEDSFPASDPPSYTAARTGKPRRKS